MLKKVVVGAMLVGLSGSVFADVCVVIGEHSGNVFNGPTFCGNGTEPDQIAVNGPLTSNGTIFANQISVNGPVNSTDTVYDNGLIDASNKSDFNHTTATSAAGIEIRKSGDATQSVYLSNSTNVSVISFDANNGLVYEDATSTVQKVKGGKVVSVNSFS